jgi:hypothetical protein
MSCYGWAWMGTYHAMGGHRSLLMVMIWAWVQVRRKMLGSGVRYPYIRPLLCPVPAGIAPKSVSVCSRLRLLRLCQLPHLMNSIPESVGIACMDKRRAGQSVTSFIRIMIYNNKYYQVCTSPVRLVPSISPIRQGP